MKATGIVRNIDELGRLVIPKELRKKLDMPVGSAIEISADGNRIILSRYYTGCHFCGSTDALIEHKDKKVCRACIEELSAL